jgi:hypothetical protein
VSPLSLQKYSSLGEKAAHSRGFSLENKFRHTAWACSSVGQSTRLISVGSKVQIFPGPPKRRSFGLNRKIGIWDLSRLPGPRKRIGTESVDGQCKRLQTLRSSDRRSAL